MKTAFFASAALIATLLTGPAMAQTAPVMACTTASTQAVSTNVTFGTQADKAFKDKYGEREREAVTDLLRENLNRELGGSRIARVDIVVNDVIPNRPTFKQLGDNPSLSFSSFGIGGADVTGKAYDGQGNLLGEVQYDWYGDIEWAAGSWTWTDADRAIGRFSRLLARSVRG